jgi:hypothetical protein
MRVTHSLGQPHAARTSTRALAAPQLLRSPCCQPAAPFRRAPCFAASREGSDSGTGAGKSSSAPRKGPPSGDNKKKSRSGSSKPAGSKPAPQRAKPAPPAPPPLPTAVVLVDPATGRVLPCLLRRSVATDAGPRALLTPLDATCALLRSSGGGEAEEDYTEVEEGSEEMAAVFPVAAAAALRQRGLVLQRCAFALTLRGVLHYTDADVISLDEGDGGATGDGESLGLEVCSFTDAALGAEYLLYSPVDPLVLLAKPADASASLPVGAATAGGIAEVAAAIGVAAGAPGGASVAVYVPAFDDVDMADGPLKGALDALQVELEAMSDV